MSTWPFLENEKKIFYVQEKTECIWFSIWINLFIRRSCINYIPEDIFSLNLIRKQALSVLDISNYSFLKRKTECVINFSKILFSILSYTKERKCSPKPFRTVFVYFKCFTSIFNAVKKRKSVYDFCLSVCFWIILSFLRISQNTLNLIDDI